MIESLLLLLLAPVIMLANTPSSSNTLFIIFVLLLVVNLSLNVKSYLVSSSQGAATGFSTAASIIVLGIILFLMIPGNLDDGFGVIVLFMLTIPIVVILWITSIVLKIKSALK